MLSFIIEIFKDSLRVMKRLTNFFWGDISIFIMKHVIAKNLYLFLRTLCSGSGYSSISRCELYLLFKSTCLGSVPIFLQGSFKYRADHSGCCSISLNRVALFSLPVLFPYVYWYSSWKRI